MTWYRIFLAAGIPFAIIWLLYALQMLDTLPIPFAVLLLIWIGYSIGLPSIFKDPRGIILGLWGSGLTSLGLYIVMTCLLDLIGGAACLFYSNGPDPSDAWLNFGGFLFCAGVLMTLSSFASAAVKAEASGRIGSKG